MEVRSQPISWISDYNTPHHTLPIVGGAVIIILTGYVEYSGKAGPPSDTQRILWRVVLVFGMGLGVNKMLRILIVDPGNSSTRFDHGFFRNEFEIRHPHYNFALR